jgi:spoIIIJ-associated protein
MTDADTTERSDEVTEDETATDSASETIDNDLEERLVAEGEIAGD